LLQEAVGSLEITILLAAPRGEIEHHGINLPARQRSFSYVGRAPDIVVRERMFDPRAQDGGELSRFTTTRHPRSFIAHLFARLDVGYSDAV
jgi:hypothetical protein